MGREKATFPGRFHENTIDNTFILKPEVNQTREESFSYRAHELSAFTLVH